MNQINKFLVDVKNLIIDPKNWTKGAAAKANGESVYADDVRADCWCLLGAIGKIEVEMSVKSKASDEIRITIAEIIGELPTNKNISISNFNDNNNHESIIFVIDQTISRITR
jgi:hypothetical protein